MKFSAAFFTAALVASVVAAPFEERAAEGELVPGKKHIMPLYTATKTAATPSKVKRQGESDPITYQGGRVMTGAVKVYNIFYGTWSATQTGLLNTLGGNLATSSYFNAEKTYTSSSGVAIGGPVTLGGSTTMSSSTYGTTLSDASLPKIVAAAIKQAGWPTSNSAIYFINTASNIKESSGFCSQYCGFHTTSTINGVSGVPYAFIGNPSGSSSCLNGCAPNNQQVSPNGDVGVDAMASIYSHEYMETLSDVNGDAWYDDQGQENADKCAYQYGTTHTLSNGAIYNEAVSIFPKKLHPGC